ncbi:ABC transporter permease [Streptococcus moroccensis]|nr:iron chelate uptake ABC transporter family permease subunit [Streptococcus moroccensis]
MKRNFFLGGLLIVLSLFSLTIGARTGFSWSALFAGDQNMWLIFQASRLPRTLSILLAGSSMSVAGLLMQTMTQNPFAAPSTVGTVEAAQLGLLLSLFVFPQATLAQKMTFSFLTAILLTLLFLKLVKSLPIKEQWVLPLIGVVYSGIIGSLATIVAYRFNLVQSMSSWLQGSFAMIQSNQYEWLFLNLIILVLAWALSSGLTLMGLGEDSSRVLGLSYRRYEVLVIVLVALTTSVTIMTVGSLPFLGVIVPNVVRLYQGDHLKRSVSTIALAGACLVMICDILARVVIAPYEVSVSVILGILGSLGFVMLLWKGRVYE